MRPRIMRAVVLLVLLWALASGCIIAKQSLTMPSNDETTVALLTGGLGRPMNDIARHPWFAVRHKGETDWMIYEVGGGGSEADPFTSHSPYVDPILHATWRGEIGERAAQCIEKHGPGIKQRIERDYFFPGPNSNTFGDEVLLTCRLAASLPATSIGKDWRGVIGVGITTERTGVQVSTPLAGFKIGLKEGIEVHIFHLAFGIDFWPPAIILPVGPGRIGFADR